MAYSDLTAEKVRRARELWTEGRSLGEIADELDLSAYDLSPWLYADEIHAVLTAPVVLPRGVEKPDA